MGRPNGEVNAVDKPPAGWTPFLAREGVVDGELLDGPHDGVPEWLFESLWRWTWVRLFGTDRGSVRHADWEFIRWFERVNRHPFGISDGALPSRAFETLREQFRTTPSLHLAALDGMLATGQTDRHDAQELDTLLHEAGSLWRVDMSQSPPALVRRVSETLEAAVLREAQRGESSGELLALAWRSAFGQNPNPSEAYRHAVRAVEAAAGPLVLPRDTDRTFGKMLAHLRDAEASWRFTLKGKADEAESVRPVREMMATLWTSQYDRHVTEGTPLLVSPEEAETAVTLAAALVHWFTSGAVSRPE